MRPAGNNSPARLRRILAGLGGLSAPLTVGLWSAGLLNCWTAEVLDC